MVSGKSDRKVCLHVCLETSVVQQVGPHSRFTQSVANGYCMDEQTHAAVPFMLIIFIYLLFLCTAVFTRLVPWFTLEVHRSNITSNVDWRGCVLKVQCSSGFCMTVHNTSLPTQTAVKTFKALFNGNYTCLIHCILCLF